VRSKCGGCIGSIDADGAARLDPPGPPGPPPPGVHALDDADAVSTGDLRMNRPNQIPPTAASTIAKISACFPSFLFTAIAPLFTPTRDPINSRDVTES
jgi:hypothetical protein